MSLFSGLKEKFGRVKGAEWAVLLIALALAGSLLLAPGAQLSGDDGTQTAGGGTGDELETRLASVLSSMEGAGRVEVAIHYAQAAVAASSWLDSGSAQQTGKEPIGVVVVAEGAGDLAVRLELARAVQTLLRLEADAVEIFKMDGGSADSKEE